MKDNEIVTTEKFGIGWSYTNLTQFRAFYKTYSNLQTMSDISECAKLQTASEESSPLNLRNANSLNEANTIHERVLHICSVRSKREHIYNLEGIGSKGNRIDEQDTWKIVLWQTTTK